MCDSGAKQSIIQGSWGASRETGSVRKSKPEASGVSANLKAFDVFVGRGAQGLSRSKTESGAMAWADNLSAFDAAIADGASIVAADVFDRKNLAVNEK